MIGFTGQGKTSTATTKQCTWYAESGPYCRDVMTQKASDRSRNFYDLLDILNDWTLLYIAQRIIQVVLPYSYMALLESASAMALSLIFFICV